ncbi:MAG: M48 family metallopeptidase [Candidatus Cloacimonetes bacterium]|nr:M48 family metallopeptidase [Candidatus Cloacimonadota bacterium]
MWELIRANQRKSAMLTFMMGIVLLAMGYVIAEYYYSGGGFFGVILAVVIWLILLLSAFSGGNALLLGVSGAKEVTRHEQPMLYNVVEEIKLAAQLPAMPRIYVIPTKAMNAFATGRKPENSTVAVTAGLLATLNRDELQGVIAHEMAHIHNRDILYMTYAGVMLGAIVLMSELFLRGLWFSGGRRSSRSSSSSGQLGLILMVVAIVMAILAPILAQILYFSISRKREYLADATAVRFTRYPEGLASALAKLSHSNIPMEKANKVTAPMYISAPWIAKGKSFTQLSSTHPPIEKRIQILRSMGSNASLPEYQSAYKFILKGKGGDLLPESALKESNFIQAKKGGDVDKAQPFSDKDKARVAGDIIRSMAGFVFINCACGLKIKVPPDYKGDKITCPRCGTMQAISH